MQSSYPPGEHRRRGAPIEVTVSLHDAWRVGRKRLVLALGRQGASFETVEGLEEKGIGFRSLTEAIDTTTSGGKLIFHIFAALAEFERSIIHERTMAGLTSARARGRLGGRPPALSSDDVAAAKAMLGDPEITVAEVARRLNVAESTLYRHLPGGRSML